MKTRKFFNDTKSVTLIALDDSKFVAFVAFMLFVSGIALILINKTRNGASAWLILAAAVSFVACYLMLRQWNFLKDYEKEVAFFEEFCISLPEQDRGLFKQYADFRPLVERALRQKARAFHDARMEQQQHFLGVDCDNAVRALQLQSNVLAAKRTFWRASDVARAKGFVVKKKYTEWLEKPAAEK